MERKNLLLCLLALLLTAACASIGNPDGGRFDETPHVWWAAVPPMVL